MNEIRNGTHTRNYPPSPPPEINPNEKPDRYDVAFQEAIEIKKTLPEEVDQLAYEQALQENNKLNIETLAIIIEVSTPNNIKLKPAYYKAIVKIFLEEYNEWSNQFKK